VIGKRLAVALTLLAVGLMVGGCKIVATPKKSINSSEETSGGAFDPNARVREIWGAKVLPYLSAKGGPFPEVIALARTSPNDAGKKFGHRPNEGN